MSWNSERNQLKNYKRNKNKSDDMYSKYNSVVVEIKKNEKKNIV